MSMAFWITSLLLGVVLYCFAAEYLERSFGRFGVWAPAIVAGLLATILIAATTGIGFTWSSQSYLAKLLATLAAATLPFAVAALAVQRVSMFPNRRWTQVAIGFLLGSIAAAVSPLVGLILVCTLTGDCP